MWKVDRGVSTDRFLHDGAGQGVPARGAETACCPATGRVHILGRPLSALE